jgi:hypothetical protein
MTIGRIARLTLFLFGLLAAGRAVIHEFEMYPLKHAVYMGIRPA